MRVMITRPRFRAILILFVSGFMAACSQPPQNSNSSGAGSQQPATSQSATPQTNSNPSAPVSPGAAQAPSTDVTATPSSETTATDKATDKAADPEKTQPAISKSAPKLIVPIKRLNFGKQPKGKTLVRTFTVKNGGLSELTIQSVEPG